MKFSKQTLLKAVESEISRRVKAAEAAYRANLAEYAQSKADWLASEHPAALAEAAKAVVAKVRRGQVVEPNDVKAFDGYAHRGHGHLFYGTKPERDTKNRQPNVATLEALRDFLATVSDNEVTSSGLREVGFRNIAAILRSAASA